MEYSSRIMNRGVENIGIDLIIVVAIIAVFFIYLIYRDQKNK